MKIDIDLVIDGMFTHTVPIGEQLQSLLGVLHAWKGDSEKENAIVLIEKIITRLFELYTPEQVIL